MTGFCGESMAKKRMDSMWRETTFRMRSWVINFIRPVPNGRPSSASTASRDSYEKKRKFVKIGKINVNEVARCTRVD